MENSLILLWSHLHRWQINKSKPFFISSSYIKRRWRGWDSEERLGGMRRGRMSMRERAPRQTLWCQRYACWCLVLVNGNHCGVFAASVPPFSFQVETGEIDGMGGGLRRCRHRKTWPWHIKEGKNVEMQSLHSISPTYRSAEDGLQLGKCKDEEQRGSYSTANCLKTISEAWDCTRMLSLVWEW